MLKQRIITAIIMITLIGAGIILLPALQLALLFGALVSVAAWEWAGLAGIASAVGRSVFTLTTIALLVASAWYSRLFSAAVQWDSVRDLLGLGCLWWSIALLWVKGYPASAVIWRAVPTRIVMGFLTLVPAWLGLVCLRLHEHGVVLIFVLIALVTAADIGAYFSGRAWGVAKLAPQVSPGKSWAGFWGGLTASVAIALLFWWFYLRADFALLPVLAVALITALASVLGDLVESMIKREQGVKDSGRILPGHGGMMDRLDSITAAAPVFALCLLLAGW